MTKKNYELRVKLSKEELEKLKRKSARLGMKPSTFLRLVGLSANISVVKE